jgi:drug/metabolite transporter (DMT)-like permease
MIARLLSAPMLIAAFAILVGTGVDALVKGVAPSVGLAALVAWRFLFGAILALGVFLAQRRPAPSWEAVRFHTARGLLQLFCAFTFFYALTQLPLAVATTLGFTAALLVAPVARLLLGERISPVAAGATLIGFAGVAFAIWGQSSAENDTGNQLLGLISLFSSTIGYAFVLVLLRMRALREDATTIALFTNAVPAIAMLPVTFGLFGGAALGDLPIFALFGVLGYSVWFLMTLAYARAPAQRLAPLEYTALIWSALLGLVFFGEMPGWQLWVGAVVIITACLVVAFEGRFRTRRETGLPASDLPE